MLFKNIFLSTLMILIVCLAIWANVVNDKRDVLVYDDLNYLTLNYIDLDSLKINLVENKFINDSLFNQEFSFTELEITSKISITSIILMFTGPLMQK